MSGLDYLYPFAEPFEDRVLVTAYDQKTDGKAALYALKRDGSPATVSFLELVLQGGESKIFLFCTELLGISGALFKSFKISGYKVQNSDLEVKLLDFVLTYPPEHNIFTE